MGTVKSKKLLGFYTHSVHVGKTGFGSLGGSPLTNRCTYRLLGKQRSFDGSAVPFLNPLKKDFLNPFIEFDIRKCVCMRVCVYAFFSCLFNKYISLWKKKRWSLVTLLGRVLYYSDTERAFLHYWLSLQSLTSYPLHWGIHPRRAEECFSIC